MPKARPIRVYGEPYEFTLSGPREPPAESRIDGPAWLVHYRAAGAPHFASFWLDDVGGPPSTRELAYAIAADLAIPST